MSIVQTEDITLIKILGQPTPSAANTYLTILKDNIFIGMFELQPMTKICSILHMNILEQYQNRGLAPEVLKELIEFLKAHTGITSLVATIPAKNKHILSVVNKTKSKCCGILQDGIVFQGELQDVILFQLNIRE